MELTQQTTDEETNTLEINSRTDKQSCEKPYDTTNVISFKDEGMLGHDEDNGDIESIREADEGSTPVTQTVQHNTSKNSRVTPTTHKIKIVYSQHSQSSRNQKTSSLAQNSKIAHLHNEIKDIVAELNEDGKGNGLKQRTKTSSQTHRESQIRNRDFSQQFMSNKNKFKSRDGSNDQTSSHQMSSFVKIPRQSVNNSAIEHFYVNKQRALNFSFSNISKFGQAEKTDNGLKFSSPGLVQENVFSEIRQNIQRNRTQHIGYRKNLEKYKDKYRNAAQMQNTQRKQHHVQEGLDVFSNSQLLNSDLKDYSVNQSHDLIAPNLIQFGTAEGHQNNQQCTSQLQSPGISYYKNVKFMTSRMNQQTRKSSQINTMSGTNNPVSRGPLSLDDQAGLDGEEWSGTFQARSNSKPQTNQDIISDQGMQNCVKSLQNAAKFRQTVNNRQKEVLSEPQLQNDKRIKKNWHKDSQNEVQKIKMNEETNFVRMKGIMQQSTQISMLATQSKLNSNEVTIEKTQSPEVKNTIQTLQTSRTSANENLDFLEKIKNRQMKHGGRQLELEQKSISFNFMKNLSDFHKTIDNIEMKTRKNFEMKKMEFMKGQKKNTQTDNLMSLKTNHNFEMQNIYIDSLYKIIGALPLKLQQYGKIFVDLHNMLHRIYKGFEETQQQQIMLFQKVISEQQRVVKDSNQQVEKITKQFDEFKLQHNLDEYFQKYLNDETREETVKQVEELMNSKDADLKQLEQLKEYQKQLRTLRPSQIGESLNNFYNELQLMSGQGGMLQFFAEDNHKNEKFLNHRMNEEQASVFKRSSTLMKDFSLSQAGEPPIGVHAFSAQLNNALDQKYNFGVYNTGKLVTQRLLNYYVKPKADLSTQTESQDAQIMQYEQTIKENGILIEDLQRQIRDQEALLIKQQSRIQDLIDEKRVIRETLNQVYADYDKMKIAYDDFRIEKQILQRDLEEYKRDWKRYKNADFESNVKLKENQIFVDEMKRKLVAKDNIIDGLRKQNNELELIRVKEQMKLIWKTNQELSEKLEKKEHFIALHKNMNFESISLSSDGGKKEKKKVTKDEKGNYQIQRKDCVGKKKLKEVCLHNSSDSSYCSDDSVEQKKKKKKPKKSPAADFYQSSDTESDIVPLSKYEKGYLNNDLKGKHYKTQAYRRSQTKRKISMDSSDDQMVDTPLDDNDNTFNNEDQDYDPTQLTQVRRLKSKINIKSNTGESKVKKLKKKGKQFDTDITINENQSGTQIYKSNDLINDNILTSSGPHSSNEDNVHIIVEKTSNLNLSMPPQNIKVHRLTSNNKQEVKDDRMYGEASTNTDALYYINFACNMFLGELDLCIQEYQGKSEYTKFKELLKACQHIIDRVKSRAAQPYGTSNYGMENNGVKSGEGGLTTGSVSTRLPQSSEIEYTKAWHFDVSRLSKIGRNQGFKQGQSYKGSRRGNASKDISSRQHKKQFELKAQSKDEEIEITELSKDLGENKDNLHSMASRVIERYSVGGNPAPISITNAGMSPISVGKKEVSFQDMLITSSPSSQQTGQKECVASSLPSNNAKTRQPMVNTTTSQFNKDLQDIQNSNNQSGNFPNDQTEQTRIGIEAGQMQNQVSAPFENIEIQNVM